MSDEKFVNLTDELNKLTGKFYKIIYKDEKIIYDCISYNQKVPELLIFLEMVVFDYKVHCVQYTLKDTDLSNEYLRMMGILFTREKTVNYSLDLVNPKNTNILEIHLINYDNNDRKVIEKIEQYPGNEEILNYMLELLSHDTVRKIFD